MIQWREASDPPTRFTLPTVTTQPGVPRRYELVTRYEQRTGRSVQALDWYVTLAMWKSAVFMEGNYKRAVAGTTDDPWLKTFGDGVVELAQRALNVTRHGF
jgi:aminoglycoside phosphotransferase (APT) family kinase protein